MVIARHDILARSLRQANRFISHESVVKTGSFSIIYSSVLNYLDAGASLYYVIASRGNLFYFASCVKKEADSI